MDVSTKYFLNLVFLTLENLALTREGDKRR